MRICHESISQHHSVAAASELASQTRITEMKTTERFCFWEDGTKFYHSNYWCIKIYFIQTIPVEQQKHIRT